MNTGNRKQAFKDIAKGGIFTVVFTKKDNTERKLNGRLFSGNKIKNALTPEQIAARYHVVNVQEVANGKAKGWAKSINLDSVTYFKANGEDHTSELLKHDI